MQNALNALRENHSGALLIVAGAEDTGFRYLAGFGAADRDARDIQTVLKETLDAKGGGSPQMVQGSIKDKTKGDIETCFESLQNAAK